MKKTVSVVLTLVLLFLLGSSALASSTLPVTQPTLTLRVVVDETCKTNVSFYAYLDGKPIGGNFAASMIDFYTGSPMLTVYPHIYLGSAPVGEDGHVEFGTNQDVGAYAGGAIFNSPIYGQVFSNVVYYEVKPVEPEKPVLSLDVRVDTSVGGSEVKNVTLTANIKFPVTLWGSPEIALPVKVDFYTGNPLLDMYPNEYVGSVYLDGGTGELSFAQEPGQYVAGAIWARTPWGDIYADQLYYAVPNLGLSLDLKVGVYNNFIMNVTYKVQVRVTGMEPVDEFSNIPGPVKVDFYTVSPLGTDNMRYIGSAVTDRSGNAVLSVRQNPGAYTGVAVCVVTPYGTFKSNPYEYRVGGNSITDLFSRLVRLFQIFNLFTR